LVIKAPKINGHKFEISLKALMDFFLKLVAMALIPYLIWSTDQIIGLNKELSQRPNRTEFNAGFDRLYTSIEGLRTLLLDHLNNNAEPKP